MITIHRNTPSRAAAWLLMLLMVFCLGSTAMGQNHRLLVINSYDEEEPWANSIAAEISCYLATNDSVSGDIVNLDNALISDSITYSKMINHVFDNYSDHHPSYVIMVGNFAFSLRDRIKEEWGDIPVLLISRIRTFSTPEENFCSHNTFVSSEQGTPIENVRNDYNFTSLFIPDYYRESVDLMVNLIPDMEEFVYLSTNIYLSRLVASNISHYIAEEYPQIKFRWVQASKENSDTLQQYIVSNHPRSGLLMASWVYEKTGARGFQTLTSNDLRLMSSSKTPIFALREAYMPLGCVGGVYPRKEEAMGKMYDIITQMLKGKSMRDIPFTNCERHDIILNYRLLEKYGLDTTRCPENTTFLNRQPTYWEKYRWQSISGLSLIILIVGGLWGTIYYKNNKLEQLRYNELFMNNMPVPFAKAEIRYDNHGEVKTIVYSNTNNAFTKLINDNAIPGNPFLLFPASFIAEKTSKLLHGKDNVHFIYHFEKTDTWYTFTLCTVLKSRKEYGMQGIVDVFASDITERIKLESQLRTTAKKLNLALNVSHTVAWQWNLKQDVVQFDDQDMLQRTTSYQVKNSNGANEWYITYNDFLLRIHPDYRHMLLKLRDDFNNGTIDTFSMQMQMYTHLHSDETDWVEIASAVTETEEDGTSKTVTGTLRVITDQKNQEEDLKLAKQRAEESDRMKSAFLANMSHEIRTPLNAIVGFSNLIAEAESEEERNEFVTTINHNSNLLLTLINDVLDLAKIESNTIDLHYTVADINAILQSAEQSIRLRVSDGVRLNMVLGCNQCICETDPVRLSQVLINLLTNACKFTKSGAITMGYMLQKQHDMLFFYVDDTGIGISKEGQSRIFERFVKLNNFAQGTGLGLSICKRLVELMGGEIGVESQGEGYGSRFWFTLPYVASKVDDTPDSGQEHNQADTGQDTQADAVPANENLLPYVLVAEDHDSNYKLLEHLLKNQYNLLHAVNGMQAVAMCEEFKPKLVLMDINMPEMNGYEAVKQIRDSGNNVPIIAVTAYAYASDRMRILNSGFNAYVAKPVSRKSLLEAMERASTPPIFAGNK